MNTTVLASGTSILSMVVKTVLTRVLAAGSHVRSMLYFTSADEKGSLLCHFTPWRSVKVHVVGFVSFHSVASEGCSLPFGWREMRLSNRLNDRRVSLADVLKCGSNFDISPLWATTSSRFCVVWASATSGRAAGSIAVAPATPAALSSSRRVR